eukprot:GHRR01032821.1.p1 GENE.GHRR01032821.1~~GHRR01032821.1.p1  ORF type:complete len:187 (+),score=54.45 GHRR01032821.1:829-1389(+)
MLEELNLSHNDIGDTGATAVAQALQSNTRLVRLDVSNTGMTEKGLIALAATLAEHNSPLSSLNISSPLLQQRPQHDTWMHLARVMANHTWLQEFRMSKAGLTDGGLEILVQQGLVHNKGSITELDLSANRLSPMAGRHIHELLEALQHLTHLNLASNRLENDGAQHIAAGMLLSAQSTATVFLSAQ